MAVCGWVVSKVLVLERTQIFQGRVLICGSAIMRALASYFGVSEILAESSECAFLLASVSANQCHLSWALRGSLHQGLSHIPDPLEFRGSKLPFTFTSSILHCPRQGHGITRIPILLHAQDGHHEPGAFRVWDLHSIHGWDPELCPRVAHYS